MAAAKAAGCDETGETARSGPIGAGHVGGSIIGRDWPVYPLARPRMPNHPVVPNHDQQPPSSEFFSSLLVLKFQTRSLGPSLNGPSKPGKEA